MMIKLIKPKVTVSGSNEDNVLVLLTQMVPICKYALF